MSARESFTLLTNRLVAADPSLEELISIVATVVDASAELSTRIARHDLLEIDALGGDRNADGDTRKPLDVYAHRLYVEALAERRLSFIASEESDTLIELDRDADYGIAIDPLDGSSNIETNLSIGTIFSVIRASADELLEIPLGERQCAAGLVCFGPQTRLVLTWGEGSLVFVLDRESGEFVTVGEPVVIPDGQCEFSINMSNYRFWEPGVRQFIDECVAGVEGRFGRDFNMRWNASLVAEACRILARGGVFLYPGDSRPGYASGRLRLLYEALPLAMIIEQAGGSASDGREPITLRRLQSLHQRVPLVFGSRERVREVIEYVSGSVAQPTRFPLFEPSGLLRN